MDFEVDHIILVVQDLDRASAAYESLGFTLTARSSHPFGTANRLISLGDSFIELLAIEDASRLGAMVAIKEMLDAAGEDTPWGVVWQMEDPSAMHRFCESLGMQPSPLQERVTRKIVHPDGTEHEACYSSFALMKSLTPRYMEGFSIQHRPAATFADAWRIHKNGGGMMKSVVVETNDLFATSEHLASFGEPLLSSNECNLGFGAGRCRLRVVPRPVEETTKGPTLTAVEVSMSNIDAVKALAHCADVDYVQTANGGIEIAPGYAAGITLRLLDGSKP